MDVFMFAHRPIEGENGVLKEPMRRWLADQRIDRCTLFTTDTKDCSTLFDEINNISEQDGTHIEFAALPLISTKDASSPSDVQKQPWEVFSEITKHIDDVHESVLLCGRSNALYDHLFWLAAQCLPNATLLNIDTALPPLEMHHEPIGGEVSPHTVSALLEFHLDDIQSGRPDKENIGYSDAERLGNKVGAGQIKGIHAALQPYTSEGLVERVEVAEGSVTYKILPKGLSEACQQWMHLQPELGEHAKKLNLVFGRLPHLSTTDEEGRHSSFDPFFEFMSPLQPVDGLLAVIQRHDEVIQGHHVLTLDAAIEQFSGTHLEGDLKHCKAVLQRRSKEDRVQTSNHLVIINPTATPLFHMEVILAVLSACRRFEQEHGRRSWSVDVTGIMAPLRSAFSMFAFVFKTSTTYIMRDRGDGDDASQLRRRDLAIPVPNNMAFSAMSRLTEGHGNNKGASNVLLALMLADIKTDEQTLANLNPFVVATSTEPIQKGLLKEEILTFVEAELRTPFDLRAGVLKQFDRTIRDNHLLERGLIQIHLPPGKANTHKRYSLTHLGRFVAEQLHRIRRNEVGN